MTSPQWICDTQGWGVFRCDQEVRGKEVSVGGEPVGGERRWESCAGGGECRWGSCGGGHCPEETVDLFVVTILTCKACYHNCGMRTS